MLTDWLHDAEDFEENFDCRVMLLQSVQDDCVVVEHSAVVNVIDLSVRIKC